MLLLAGALAAQEGAPPLEPDPLAAVRRRVPEERLVLGLDYLVRCQDPLSGAVGGLRGQVGVTALATLALLAHGSPDLGRGPYGEPVLRGIGYLVEHQRPSGYFNVDGDDLSRMHGHGYATLALAEACGAFGADRRVFRSHASVRRALARAVDLIVESQGSAGAWMYEPDAREGHEGSITVCMIQALGAARECGVVVPDRAIQAALRYLERTQAPDGSFRYALGVERTSFELTAAATMCLVTMGRHASSEVARGRARIADGLDAFLREPAYPFYGAFYAAQSLWMDRDAALIARHLPPILDFLLSCQDPQTGSFSARRGVPRARLEQSQSIGPVYASAMALLTLQIPRGLLPLFNR